jgi:hypothetical protein
MDEVQTPSNPEHIWFSNAFLQSILYKSMTLLETTYYSIVYNITLTSQSTWQTWLVIKVSITRKLLITNSTHFNLHDNFDIRIINSVQIALEIGYK